MTDIAFAPARKLAATTAEMGVKTRVPSVTATAADRADRTFRRTRREGGQDMAVLLGS